MMLGFLFVLGESMNGKNQRALYRASAPICRRRRSSVLKPKSPKGRVPGEHRIGDPNNGLRRPRPSTIRDSASPAAAAAWRAMQANFKKQSRARQARQARRDSLALSTTRESAPPAAAASSAAPQESPNDWHRMEKGDELLHRKDNTCYTFGKFVLEYWPKSDKSHSEWPLLSMTIIPDSDPNAILWSHYKDDKRAHCNCAKDEDTRADYKKEFPTKAFFDPEDFDVKARRRLTSLERIIRGAQQFEELKRSQGLV